MNANVSGKKIFIAVNIACATTSILPHLSFLNVRNARYSTSVLLLGSYSGKSCNNAQCYAGIIAAVFCKQ